MSRCKLSHCGKERMDVEVGGQLTVSATICMWSMVWRVVHYSRNMQPLELCYQSSKNLYCGLSGLPCLEVEGVPSGGNLHRCDIFDYPSSWHWWEERGWDISNWVKDTKLFLSSTDKIHLVLVFWFPHYMNINFSKIQPVRVGPWHLGVLESTCSKTPWQNLKILFFVLKTILKESYTFNLSIIVYITELQLICIVVVVLISNLHLKGLGRELVTPLF